MGDSSCDSSDSAVSVQSASRRETIVEAKRSREEKDEDLLFPFSAVSHLWDTSI